MILSSLLAVSILASADVAVGKGAVPSPVRAGSNLTYTIRVKNFGPDDAAYVTLFDKVPQPFTTFVSLTSPAGWSCGTPASGSTGSVVCATVSLAAGSEAVFTFVVHVAPETFSGAQIMNTASISSTFDPNSINDMMTVTTPVLTTAELSVTKTLGPEPGQASSNVTYTIGVTNSGPSNAANVIMGDTLPPNTTFVSLTAPALWTCSTPAAGAAGTVSCGKATMWAGTETFTLILSAVAGSTFSNTATVSTSTEELSSADNSATVTATTAQAPGAPALSRLMLGLLAALLALLAFVRID